MSTTAIPTLSEAILEALAYCPHDFGQLINSYRGDGVLRKVGANEVRAACAELVAAGVIEGSGSFETYRLVAR